MHASTAHDLLRMLQALSPIMIDGYKMSRALELDLVEAGALGRGVHGRYAANTSIIQIAGLGEMSSAFATDTITHEYTHAMLAFQGHTCARFKRTGGHCSHFVAEHKRVQRAIN